MLGHKVSIDKFKKIEIISSFFIQSQCYETRNKLQENNAKNTNTWRLNNMLLNNQVITK